MRILLIDDDEQFREDLLGWLTDNLKHIVAVAGSVDEAKQQLGRERYHAILLDSYLRETVNDLVDSNRNGGLEILRYMSAARVSKKVCKTVLVTAHNVDDLSEPALLGCNRFVFKSWRFSDTGQPSEQFHQKLKAHLDQLAAERWNPFTTIVGAILGVVAILLVAAGVIWQIFEQFTPALFTALVGNVVSILSFLAFLTGRPINALWNRQRR